jgi:hypothetical protein
MSQATPADHRRRKRFSASDLLTITFVALVVAWLTWAMLRSEDAVVRPAAANATDAELAQGPAVKPGDFWIEPEKPARARRKQPAAVPPPAEPADERETGGQTEPVAESVRRPSTDFCRNVNSLPPQRMVCRTKSAKLILTPTSSPVVLPDLEMRVLSGDVTRGGRVRIRVRARRTYDVRNPQLNASGRQIYLFIRGTRIYTKAQRALPDRAGHSFDVVFQLPARLARERGQLMGDLGVIPFKLAELAKPRLRGVIRLRLPRVQV